MNNHAYSIEYILLVLELIIQDKILNFNKENIFRYSYCKVSLKALEDYITLILNKEKTKKSLPNFINLFNIDAANIENNLNISLPNFAKELESDVKSKNKKFKISHNVISMLLQQVFIHGCLLRQYDLRDYAAWTILFDELGAQFSIQQSSPKVFENILKTDTLKNIFVTYLNHLCSIDNQKTAEALHNFLYLSHLVVSHNAQNKITKNGLAKILSICLSSGLEFERKMKKSLFIEDSEPEKEIKIESEIKPEKKSFFPKKPKSSKKQKNTDIVPLKSSYTKDLLQENNFFADLINYLLTSEPFQKPFSLTDYDISTTEKMNKTNKQIHQTLIKKIWEKPGLFAVPYTNDIFHSNSKELSLSPNEGDMNASPQHNLTRSSYSNTISSSPKNELIFYNANTTQLLRPILTNSGPLEEIISSPKKEKQSTKKTYLSGSDHHDQNSTSSQRTFSFKDKDHPNFDSNFNVETSSNGFSAKSKKAPQIPELKLIPKGTTDTQPLEEMLQNLVLENKESHSKSIFSVPKTSEEKRALFQNSQKNSTTQLPKLNTSKLRSERPEDFSISPRVFYTPFKAHHRSTEEDSVSGGETTYSQTESKTLTPKLSKK